MKRIIIILVSIIVFGFILIFYMVNSDNKYYKNLKNEIIDNTRLTSVSYMNKYDNYYIVCDNDYLYLIDMEYNVLLDIKLALISKNIHNYDIIYKDDKFMFFNDVYDNGKLIYEYYDLYTYKSIDRVLVGG